MNDMDLKVPEPLDRLLDEAIKPNAEQIARICLDSDVAIVFFNLAPTPLVREPAQILGWKGGECEVRRLKHSEARRFASALNEGDRTAAGWLRRRKQGRIFVLMERGTLCVNFTPGWGFSIEPGTADTDWMN